MTVADLIYEGCISSSDPCWSGTRYFLLCVCVRGQLAANCFKLVSQNTVLNYCRFDSLVLRFSSPVIESMLTWIFQMKAVTLLSKKGSRADFGLSYMCRTPRGGGGVESWRRTWGNGSLHHSPNLHTHTQYCSLLHGFWKIYCMDFSEIVPVS